MQFRTTVTFEELDGARITRVVREYGAAKGAEQTPGRLAAYVAGMS